MSLPKRIRVGSVVACTECSGRGYKARSASFDHLAANYYGGQALKPAMEPVVCGLCKGTRKVKVVAK